MRVPFGWCYIALFLLSCSGARHTDSINRLSAADKKQGWKLLFDGKTTKGWHRYGGGAIDSVWKTGEGMLWLDVPGKNKSKIKGDWDIVTDEEYDHYELELEWKISINGNSGIIFFIHEDPTKYQWPWQTGPEMQVLDNNGHPDAKFVKHRAGDLYDLISCTRETVRPAGEWNQVKIRSQNGKLELYLNGEQVVTCNLWDDNWKKMVAGSKFKSMPGFGTYKKGRIGLQDHGDVVYYRNIRIRKL